MFTLPDQIKITLFACVLTFIFGILLEKFKEKKPKLIYYLSSLSDFSIPSNQAGQQNTHINTHNVVVQNDGRSSAKNVEIAHHPLTSTNFWYKVNPDIAYSIDKTPQGGLIIRIPSLLPKQALTISYLYTYPFQINQIHNYVKSDEVAGEAISILYVRQTPKWAARALIFFGILGLVYLVQILWLGFQYLVKIAGMN